MWLRIGIVPLLIFGSAAQVKAQPSNAAQLDEYRRACATEREQFFRDERWQTSLDHAESQFQSDSFLDPTNAYQAEMPGHRRTLEVYFWHNDNLTAQELQRRIGTEFGKGPGSLNRLMVCAGRVRLAQLERLNGKPTAPPPQSKAAAGLPARAILTAPTVTVPPVRRIVGFKDAKGETHILGRQGTASVAAVVNGSSKPAPSPTDVAVRRRAPQMQAERAGFQKMRSRVVHNRANDATACLKVTPTGVVSEWGIEGRYRLMNTCSHPVEASWCANVAECSDGRGSTWTIRALGSYPIFFADANDPAIAVGACKAGSARQPPLGEQREVARMGFSEGRDLPQPARGVSLLQDHRCE